MDKQNAVTSVNARKHTYMMPENISHTFFKSLDSKYQRMEAIKIASKDEQGL